MSSNLITRRNKAIEGAQRRVQAVRDALAEQTAASMRPSQEELRAQFDKVAEGPPAGLDVFEAMYGKDELTRQWALYLKRKQKGST